MKRTMKKMLSFGLVAAMSLTMLAGCGNSKDATNDTNVSNGQEEKKPTGDVKIGVLVQDVSGEDRNFTWTKTAILWFLSACCGMR